MSHPIPGHTYGENEYESHSPHKESTAPRRKPRADLERPIKRMLKVESGAPLKKAFDFHGRQMDLITSSLRSPKASALAKKTGKANEMHKRAKHFA